MSIPKEVLQIAEILKQAGHQAYLVGGCVRDLLLGVEPKDWDITTSAKPEVVLQLFPDSVYENQFGTVGIKTQMNAEKNADERGENISENLRINQRKSAIVEVTTFRLEGKYTDKRHPDEVKFAKTVEEDLSRRDFTVNAMALDLGAVGNDGDARNVGDEVITQAKRSNISNKRSDQTSRTFIDPYGGQKDLKAKVIRAVGDPEERFTEDALRLLRAVRFSAQLDFKIEKETQAAIQKHAGLLEFISKERIRDEFSKLLMTARGHEGVERMRELGLLKYVVPELLEGVGVEQNQHHIYSVYEHNLKSLQYAVEKNFSLELRLASLLHDVGKPASRQWKNTATGKKVRIGKATRPARPGDAQERGDWTFYGHQVIGAKMAVAILERLKFSREIIEQVSLLVYEHMFVYDPDVVTLAGVRRLLSRVGNENVGDLIKVREADRIGSGVPKAQPYRLRYLQAMIEKVKTDPISAKMIAIKGEEVIKTSGLTPGPSIGAIIAILLEEILEDPKRNDKKQLAARVKELAKLPEKKLIELSHASKKRAATEQEKIDEEIKKKYFV